MGIIEALSHLKDSEKIPLVVVGSGKSYLKKVLQRIKELKLQELIIFKNDIRDIEELKGLYQHAQMMIYPSFYEGFGIPIIESLLCETPVITSKTSALPEAAGPGAHYINPKQTQEIAEGIRLLQTDVSYRNELVSKGKKYVMNEFHPSVTSDKTHEAISGLTTVPLILIYLTKFKNSKMQKVLFILTITLFFSTLSAQEFLKFEGIVTLETKGDAPQLVPELTSMLEAKGYTVFSIIDHQENASTVGTELNFSNLIIFGNPEMGSQVFGRVSINGS